MIGNKGVQVTCKRCNQKAYADEFVLDHIYKMMVCPACVKERKTKERMAQKGQDLPQTKSNTGSILMQKQAPAPQAQPEVRRPSDWDAEDDMLEKSYKKKEAQMSTVQIERIDDDHVKYRCPKCNFKTTYNLITRSPRTCGYCKAEISAKVNY